MQDIVSGIDEYLDEVTVLPPSIWDPNVRLAPPKKTRTLVSNPPCHPSLVTISNSSVTCDKFYWRQQYRFDFPQSIN